MLLKYNLSTEYPILASALCGVEMIMKDEVKRMADAEVGPI
jgi:hypothetical protein